MKSAPGRSTVYAPVRAGGGPVSEATCAADGAGADDRGGAAGCASTIGGLTTSAAVAAALCRKVHRPTPPPVRFRMAQAPERTVAQPFRAA